MSYVVSHKVVLCGESSVGKSSLALRFCRNDFSEFIEPTVGASFLTQTIQIDDCIMRLELWDTAGQERYRSLAPMYYRGAAAALIVFDVTSAESFEGAQSWARELRRRGDPAMVVALVGNKVDIGHRVVELETAKTYATDNEFLYFETSAKTGYNVGELFIAIAKRLPRSSRPRDADILADLKGDDGAGSGKGSGSGGSGSKSGCC